MFVGGLAPAVTSVHIQDAFIPFGEIADVSLPKNESANATDPHRGFAYVEFEDPDDAKEAIDNMDQSELFGRVIKVSAAKLPKSKDEGLGSRTALWAQVIHSSLIHASRESPRLCSHDGPKLTRSSGRLAGRERRQQGGSLGRYPNRGCGQLQARRSYAGTRGAGRGRAKARVTTR